MRIANLSERERHTIDQIGVSEVLAWQKKLKAAANMTEWKIIGAEFRDKYELTTPEALNLLRLE